MGWEGTRKCEAAPPTVGLLRRLWGTHKVTWTLQLSGKEGVVQGYSLGLQVSNVMLRKVSSGRSPGFGSGSLTMWQLHPAPHPHLHLCPSAQWPEFLPLTKAPKTCVKRALTPVMPLWETEFVSQGAYRFLIMTQEFL